MAVDKLTPYYDQMSPIVGVALMLDPRKSKRDKYLKKLDWEDSWINTALDNFDVSYLRTLQRKIRQKNIKTVIPKKRATTHIEGFDSWERNLNGVSSDIEEAEVDEKSQYFGDQRHSGDFQE
jgi:hypothetical protein